MTKDAATLLALAERAEKGGDETLSDDVWRAMGWEPETHLEWAGVWRKPRHPHRTLGDLMESIDAQRNLPGRITEIYETSEDLSVGRMREFHAKSTPLHQARAPTEALARLSALLRAMAASP